MFYKATRRRKIDAIYSRLPGVVTNILEFVTCAAASVSCAVKGVLVMASYSIKRDGTCPAGSVGKRKSLADEISQGGCPAMHVLFIAATRNEPSMTNGTYSLVRVVPSAEATYTTTS